MLSREHTHTFTPVTNGNYFSSFLCGTNLLFHNIGYFNLKKKMLILIFLHGRRILFSIKKFNLSGFFLQSLSFKHLPFWDKFTTSDYLKGSGLLQIFLLQRWTWKSLTSKLGVYLWMLLPEFVPMWFPVCSLGPAAMEMEVSLDCAPERICDILENSTTECFEFLRQLLMDFTSHSLILEARMLIQKWVNYFYKFKFSQVALLTFNYLQSLSYVYLGTYAR